MPSEFEIFARVFTMLLEKKGTDKVDEAAREAKACALTGFAVYREEKKEEKKPA